ncbi:hypothetical protein SAMN05518865_104269 [Duganella sp. CF458]|nr:hypothetical protein SAMN05518865_104269 [Duganella sp. CF458]
MISTSPTCARQACSSWRIATASCGEIAPCWCDPGTTCTGPSSAQQGSRCRRTATICSNKPDGGCAYQPSSLHDHPRKTGSSTRSCTGILKSWCTGTSQFTEPDFSKEVHWTATWPTGSTACNQGEQRRESASSAHQACDSNVRDPALPRARICAAYRAHCPASATPGMTANPRRAKSAATSICQGFS